MTTKTKPEEKPSSVGGTISTSAKTGLCEVIFSVYGVLDTATDLAKFGAFQKDITPPVFDQRGNIIGRVMGVRDVKRADLPADVLKRYPEATGGAAASLNLFTRLPEGLKTFQAIAQKKITSFNLTILPTEVEYQKMVWRGKNYPGTRWLMKARLQGIQPILSAPNAPKKSVMSPAERARKLAECKALIVELQAMQRRR